MITFSDGTQFESETHMLLNLPEPQGEPTARITVRPLQQEEQVAQANVPYQPLESAVDAPARTPTQGIDRPQPPNLYRDFPPRKDAPRTQPLRVGEAETMTDETPMGLGTTASMSAAERNNPRPGRVPQEIGGGGAAPGRNEPPAGPIERSGVSTYNREVGRNPETGQFARQPSDMGGTGRTWEQQRSTREAEGALSQRAVRGPRPLTPAEREIGMQQTPVPVATRNRYVSRRNQVPSAVERAAKARELRYSGSSGEQTIKFNGADGKEVKVKYSLTNDGKNVDIGSISNQSWTPGKTGLSYIRKLVKMFQEKYPNIETISGLRVSGARARSGSGPMASYIKVPKRK